MNFSPAYTLAVSVLSSTLPPEDGLGLRLNPSPSWAEMIPSLS
ncbi:hypothetical protein CABS01_07901 [Colletotrichum abscissum]|nr:uncharacterized protein CABS01_07901 [Colletotrichum abscissum]KAK1510229.1 hypothetical protein CABS01_07901 [Colletotrichum abscissum]